MKAALAADKNHDTKSVDRERALPIHLICRIRASPRCIPRRVVAHSGGMPPSSGGRSGLSTLDEDELTLDAAMDRADRASNRMEVRQEETRPPPPPATSRKMVATPSALTSGSPTHATPPSFPRPSAPRL